MKDFHEVLATDPHKYADTVDRQRATSRHLAIQQIIQLMKMTMMKSGVVTLMRDMP